MALVRSGCPAGSLFMMRPLVVERLKLDDKGRVTWPNSNGQARFKRHGALQTADDLVKAMQAHPGYAQVWGGPCYLG